MHATSCVLQRCGPNTHRRTHEITTITLTVRVSVVRKPIQVGGVVLPPRGWVATAAGGVNPPMEKSAAAAAGGGDPSPGIAQLLLRGVNPPPTEKCLLLLLRGGDPLIAN